MVPGSSVVPGPSHGGRVPALVWVEQAPEQAEPAEWIVTHEWEGAPFLCVGRVGSRYLLRAPGLADYWMTEDGRSVDVVASPESSRAHVQEVYEQLIVPGIDQLAGTPAIHASAVAHPHGTLAFLGPSGAGKSTLAGLLSRRWSLVADDYLPLALQDTTVLALPSSTWVRVREPALREVGGAGTLRAGKLAVERPSAAEPRPLARIYALEVGDEGVLIEPCSRRDGMVLLASQLHRLDTKDPTLLGAELTFVEAVATRVPMRRLRYPRSFDVMAAVEAAIDQDLKPEETP